MNIFLGLLPPVLWGSTYAAIGLYLTDIPSIWLAFWRALPAGLILLLMIRRAPRVPFKRVAVLGFINISLFFSFLLIGAYRLPGGVAGTLGATLPLQLILIQWLVFKKKPTVKALMASIFGLIGVALILNPSADLDPIGVAAALFATFLIAVASILMYRWKSDDVIGLAAWQLILGGVFLFPIAWVVSGPIVIPSVEQLPGLVWLVGLNTALGYVVMIRALNIFGATTFGIFSLLNPVTAVTLGVLFIGENLGGAQWAGIAIVLGSLLLNQVRWHNLRVKQSKLKERVS
ncbi:DMT family transporter [Marinomonas mediterranea]|uniref:DMT family transporter n=1 Tax=Marinomonas mediterranea TaxID=119864 RepID=UPI00234A8E9E|nr:EamA family transporter [Marinomonas mediterranea]WCN08827.1 EamA family transporter [Marinomonas mediterranea]WCN12872.1 EamA family transporter [Marinomonas mediterranea]